LSILVGIPAFNAESTIEEIVVKSSQYTDNILVVNDGSTDKTSAIIKELGINIVTHEKKKGYGTALQSIFNYAKETMNEKDILVILDSDGQHDPDDISKLCEPIQNGIADVSTGTRFELSQAPKHRKIISKAFARIMKTNLEDSQCGFRAYSSKAVEMMNLHENGWGMSLEILRETKRLGLPITEVPIKCDYNKNSHSTGALQHGSSLVESLLWLVIFRRPLTILGIPALLLLVGSLVSASFTLYLYVTLNYLVLSWALITISCLIVGMLLAFSAILFYVMSRRFPYE